MFVRPHAAMAIAIALALPARAEDLGGQKAFRDIFFSLLAADQKMPLKDAQKLLYAMPVELRLPPDEAFAGPPFQAMDALFRKHRPSELYALGARQEVASSTWNVQFEKRAPVLLVILPGIFGEFIAHPPFEEAFANQKSAFARQFQDAVARAAPADKTDGVYSLHDLAVTQKPIAETMSVTSFDDEKGQPLVKAVFMKPGFASLETLGTIEDNTQIYLRRLAKLFKLVGAQDFYLVGYSRGLPVALQVAVEAHDKQVAFARHLRGVVSLAGVTYGTPLADVSFKAGDPTHELIGVLTQLCEGLHSLPTDLPAKPSLKDELHLAKLVEQNWILWGKAALKIKKIEANGPVADPGIALEQIKQSLPGVRATFQLVREFAWEQFKLIHIPKFRHIEAGEHFKNIARLKMMVPKLVSGVQALTTESRLNWWRTHTLPPHLTTYAIGATMADAARPERANTPLFDAKGVCSLAKDPVSTFVDSVDFHSLRSSYYQLVAASGGCELNDSQVPLQRVRFWPKINRQLNPKQADFKAYFLGVLGQDHWGLSFPVAFDQQNKRRNPFPRATLLKAIGTFVARHP